VKHLPPPFFERPFLLQLVGGIVVPAVFGILTGFTLSVHEILYYALSGPIAILGGFLAGVEHRDTGEAFLRGAVGGLIFGSFILLGNEMLNPDETKAHLPDPQSGLVFVTSIGGAILGALGARFRIRQERRAALSG
jgi:phosphotransferase system  glucose/maltose/N-acetylglucosamine-specific IIC component